MLPEQVNKHTLADWKDSAATFVRQQLFDKKQFVTDKELMFGGTIQELVYTDINISEKKTENPILLLAPLDSTSLRL